MSATAATKKQKPLKRHPSKLKQASAYTILAIILISIVAVLFAFPLYWIITGSFKTGAAINATTPEWWPSQWVLTNYQKLFAGKSAPLWQLAVPFGSKFSADGEPIYFSVGPTAPAAIRWMINTVFMAVMSMIFTCITAAMAGYALAKKRFVGRKLLFSSQMTRKILMHRQIRHFLDQTSGRTGSINLMLAQNPAIRDREILHQYFLCIMCNQSNVHLFTPPNNFSAFSCKICYKLKSMSTSSISE